MTRYWLRRQSEADLALCSALAFWTGRDADRIDRLFRSSGLMREKWERADYREETIAKAVERSEFYEAPAERPSKPAGRHAAGADDREAREQLGELLALPSVGVEVTGARIVGHGLKASADIFFSNGETVTFDPLRDLLTPTVLKGEVTLATGAMPTRATVETGQRVLALLRRMAERQESLSEDEDATNWCLTYLQMLRAIECDVEGDMAERWRAFSELRREERQAAESGVPLYIAARLMLVAPTGRRYVRSAHFCNWVRKTQEPKQRSNAAIHTRVLRVGWERRASEGRINARQPGFDRGEQLNWAFLEVPAGWEDGR